MVGDAGGVLTLRVKLGRGPEARAELAQAQELGIPVDGVVTEVVKGGVVGRRRRRPRLLPGVADRRPVRRRSRDLRRPAADASGSPATSRATWCCRAARCSRRSNAKRAAETRKKLEPGAVLRGKVVGFKPFGAFVDLGGIEGMLHVSELGYARVEKPEDVLSLGQEVDVAVLKVEPAAKGDKRRADQPVAQGARQRSVARHGRERSIEGTRVRGKITRLSPFGAFVEIAPGVEGLVHISELGAGRRINHPKEVVAVGQEVEAVVLSIDHERRRIGLSMASSSDGTAPRMSPRR